MKWGKTYCYHSRVEFEEVDALKTVHHPVHLKYCERARTATMRDEDYPFLEMLSNGFALVIDEAKIRYRRPLTYGDEFRVYSRLAAVSTASFRVRQLVTTHPGKSFDEIDDLDLDLWEQELQWNSLIDLVLVHVDLETLKPTAFHNEAQDVLGVRAVAREELKSRRVRLS